MSRVVKQMSPDKDNGLRKELLIAATLVGVGLAITAISLTELKAERPHLAQATQQPQPSPPAESKPGGTRPTTPAPEPARPDAEAQKEGAKPALPPAPAEKVAPPIKEK
jgi:hypothetical protein